MSLSLNKIFRCIDPTKAFAKEARLMVVPDEPFRVVPCSVLQQPLECLKVGDVYRPVVIEVAQDYASQVKSIQWFLVVTVIGDLRILPVNLNSNDSWSRSKHALFSVDEMPIRAIRNRVGERFDFEIEPNERVGLPSEEQVMRFLSDVLEKLVIDESNIENLKPFIQTSGSKSKQFSPETMSSFACEVAEPESKENPATTHLSPFTHQHSSAQDVIEGMSIGKPQTKEVSREPLLENSEAELITDSNSGFGLIDPSLLDDEFAEINAAFG